MLYNTTKTMEGFYFSASGFGNALAELQPSAPGAEITETTVLTGLLSDAKIKALAENCKLETDRLFGSR